MEIDDENDVHFSERIDLELKLRRFVDYSKCYLNRLPLIKRQLEDINRLNQSDLYIEKLDEIDKIVHDLVDNIHIIEQLYSELNDDERKEFVNQIQLLRTQIDREMFEFHRLREQFFTNEENVSSISNTNEENFSSNELRQRTITKTRLDNSYDSLEQDFASLREAIDQVATLIAHQNEILSKSVYLKNVAESRFRTTTKFIQRFAQNRYVTIASGAVLGASIAGPVGFMMGAKVGALVALSGSAVGALSLNIMRQRMSQSNELQCNTDAISYDQAML